MNYVPDFFQLEVLYLVENNGVCLFEFPIALV